tara:strand:- start:455 stop:772 length:318 start_codon:yes stop_codon:yes gene_type:complete
MKIFKSVLTISFLFLVSSCASGSITLNNERGSKISIKRDNVNCSKEILNGPWGRYVNCNVNGIITDLTGRREVYSELNRHCFVFEEGMTPACQAARHFGLYKVEK